MSIDECHYLLDCKSDGTPHLVSKVSLSCCIVKMLHDFYHQRWNGSFTCIHVCSISSCYNGTEVIVVHSVLIVCIVLGQI